jgi:hypothetical protein
MKSMTVNKLIELASLTPITVTDPDREILGAYVGDLLSWVMGRAEESNAWITIMSNVNVIAVASLVDVSCVILAEGVKLDDGVENTAAEKGINILSTDKSAYETAKLLASLEV